MRVLSKRGLSALLVFIALLLLTACSQGFSLDREELELALGETAVLTVQGIELEEITWSSSDTNVATVDLEGKVTSVGPGNAVITASVGNKSATCTVVVTSQPVLSADSLVIGLGSTRQISVYPKLDGQSITWQSGDAGIAEVDQAGNISGLAPGDTEVTASMGDFNLVCNVHVFALDSAAIVLVPGELVSLSVTSAPAGSSIFWQSSNTDVVSVGSSGEITAGAVGEAIITADIDGGMAKCAVTVLGIAPGNLVMDSGEVQQLQLTPAFEGETVVWRSDDSSIAKVDSGGKVTAGAPGLTRIYATAGGKELECIVLVATDIGKHRITSVTGAISMVRSFSPDGSMLISYTPPFGGANENGAVLFDLQGKEYSLPQAPCSEVCWYGKASWQGSKFVYSVAEDWDWGNKAAIYVYDTEDHSNYNITQGFDWARYKDYYISDFAPAFTAEDIISVVFPDGLWQYDLGSKVWTQASESQRGEGPSGSYPTYWSPDYSKVAWLERDAAENKLTVYDIDADSQKSVSLPQSVINLLWSPDSAKLAWIKKIMTGDDNELVVLDIASGVQSTVHQATDIADFLWSRDSNSLAVAGCRWNEGQGRIWFPITVVSLAGEEIKSIPDPGNTWSGGYVDTNLSWVPGQDMLAYDTKDGLVLLRLTDGKRWLVRPPLPSKEMKAHELYEMEEEWGFPMEITWLDNGNLALSIHFDGRFTYGTMDIYKIDWKNWK